MLKFFVKRKGIYSFKLGYFNGIAIMLMVAYVMGPIYRSNANFGPKYKTQLILIEFFRLFSEWDWINGQIYNRAICFIDQDD